MLAPAWVRFAFAMRALVYTLLMRNGVVAGAVIVLVTALRFVPHHFYWPAAILVLLGILVGFAWACGSLAKKIGRTATAGLTVLVVLIVGLFSWAASVPIARDVVEDSYKEAGYEMRRGCNLAAASRAQIALFMISNRIDEVKEDSPSDTNELRRLQEELAATKERLKFLKADLARRGHRGTVPVRKDANKTLQPPAAAAGDSHHD